MIEGPVGPSDPKKLHFSPVYAHARIPTNSHTPGGARKWRGRSRQPSSKSMKTSIKLLCSLLLGLVLAPGLFAQTTAFTYQGRLNQSGSLVNGIYDMQFSLFNVVSGGASVAGPLSATLGVTGGLFTASLDFTGTPFTGQNLWLQIAVRTNGVGSYSNLAPRQPITSTPYAIRSINAGTAATATTATGVAANGVNSAAIQNASITGAKIANSQVVRSLNGMRDDLSIIAGPNITLTPGAGTLTLGSSAWSLAGNAGTTPGANFLGASDNAQVRLHATGGFLVDNTTPGISFGNQVRQMLNLWNTGYGIGVQAATLYQRTDGNFAWHLSGSHADGTGDPGPGGTNLMFLDYTGHLLVNGGITVDNANANTGGYYPGLVFGPGSGESIASKRDAGLNQYGLDFYTGFLKRMSILNDGGDQVGTIHLGGYGANGEPKVIRFGDGDYVHVGENGSDDTLELKGTRIYMTANSESSLRVGIGTVNPAEKLHVNGNFIRVEGAGGEQAYLGGDGFGGDVQIGSFNPGVTAVAFWNAPNADYMHVYCKAITITGGADLAEPFEMSHKEIPQGAVVVIDEENPGQLKMSAEAYDTHVAGIVSGAGGINPGIQLKQQGALDGGQNVALTGRVYALADATSAPIKPGDLLTTSTMPGHCMKAGDRGRAQGAILGKAMTGLKEGQGKVLVLVTLQ
jgi:hypothetical protein